MKALLLSLLPAAFGRSLLQTYSPGPAYGSAACLPLNETFLGFDSYSYIMAALEQTGLSSVLEDPASPVTMFVPNNQAVLDLAAAANATVEELLDLPELTDVLSYHVVPQPFDNRLAFDQGSAPFPYGSVIPQGTGITVPTLLSGANLTVLNINQTNYVYSYGIESGIIGTYENACNVILYPIDSVLLPEQDFLFSGAAELETFFYNTLLTPTPITGPQADIDAVHQGNVNAVAQGTLDAMASGVTPQQVTVLFFRVFAEPAGPQAVAQVANAMLTLSSCPTVSPVLQTVLSSLQARNNAPANAEAQANLAQYPQLAQCAAQATGGSALAASG